MEVLLQDLTAEQFSSTAACQLLPVEEFAPFTVK